MASPAPSIVFVAEPAPPTPRQGRATIVEADARGLVLVEGDQRFVASRAASCLLEPEPGDRVWFVAEGEEAHVIAVLERAASTRASLRVPGDAELRSDGSLTIASGRDLELRGEARVAVDGDELQVRTRVAKLVLDECSAVLRSLFTHVQSSTFVGKLVELFADRLSTHSKTSVRTVETHDHVEAGSIDYRAQHTASLEAKHTRVTGGELVKVDGGQIHVG